MNTRSIHFLIAALLILLCPGLQAQSSDRYNIIPYPTSLTPNSGQFIINQQTTLYIAPQGAAFRKEALFLQQMIRGSLGSNALKESKRAQQNAIILQYDPSIAAEEGYAATIESQQVILKARSASGMFHAIQTLRQLMPADIEKVSLKTATIPAAEIKDQPHFAWRGMMLDVSRHFFSIAYVKKFIDIMALYKFNTLHLHLTDDQGWRIEIKKYPELTSHDGWRGFNNQDSACMRMASETGNTDFNIDSSHLRTHDGQTQYGGFYTQQQMRDIIQYAALHHIEIIPEIDMPGHMMAAVTLYPWLTCDGKTGDERAGGFSNPICPCKDSAMQFAKNVFSEIIALFPSKYIHIGGDEVEKSNWASSQLCHGFMHAHNIKTLDELQSYFNLQMQNFFHAHGKTLVGWDEIVEGGMDSTAVVMFWRNWAPMAPLKATSNGNNVVMSADGPLYFDAIPDHRSLSEVYHYDPTNPSYRMNAAQQKHVIGVQANLWTEMVPSEKRADYLVMPRMMALAERGWTNEDHYDLFLQRLQKQYPRLDYLGINYRLPDLPQMVERRAFIDTTSFFIASPAPGFTIHYTTDNSAPDISCPALIKPVFIDHSLVVKLAAFTPAGRRGDVYPVNFDRQPYAVAVNISNLIPGLRCQLFKGRFEKTTKMPAHADSLMTVQQFEVPQGIKEEKFGLKFTGYIVVPETGIYTFFLTSNDGSVLKIADRLVVDNDGLHPDKEKSGQVALQKGKHAVALDFIEAGGGYSLKLLYSRNNEAPQSVPASWLVSAQ